MTRVIDLECYAPPNLSDPAYHAAAWKNSSPIWTGRVSKAPAALLVGTRNSAIAEIHRDYPGRFMTLVVPDSARPFRRSNAASAKNETAPPVRLHHVDAPDGDRSEPPRLRRRCSRLRRELDDSEGADQQSAADNLARGW